MVETCVLLVQARSVRESHDLLRSIGRLLSFRLSREELFAFDWRHLAVGLGATWVVGMGRTWDDPTVSFLRKTGVGSLAYVFVLSLVLWLSYLPVRAPGVPRLRYRDVLTFVTLTAPPALLYAIPVERFTSVDVAISLNLLFLGVVATWRVALLLHYFSRAAGLRWYAVAVAALLPLAVIVSGLTFLKLAEGVIAIMGGLRERHPDDGVNQILILLTVISYVVAIPLLLAYAVVALLAHRARRQDRLRSAPPAPP